MSYTVGKQGCQVQTTGGEREAIIKARARAHFEFDTIRISDARHAVLAAISLHLFPVEILSVGSSLSRGKPWQVRAPTRQREPTYQQFGVFGNLAQPRLDVIQREHVVFLTILSQVLIQPEVELEPRAFVADAGFVLLGGIVESLLQGHPLC